LEHQQSSEDSTGAGYFADWDRYASARELPAHEYAHIWNGKFRRPADLSTDDFATPMGDSLLWVYEGQTQYWGYVLAARSGLHSRQEALDALAITAALYDDRAGRSWRDLADTTADPVVSARAPKAWASWQRSEDYYAEGLLLWLEVDTRIRDLTGDRKSLDDFAKTFFGRREGLGPPVRYTFEDLVAALNQTAPYDWASLLRTRLTEHAQGAPLTGLALGGYRLVYGPAPSAYGAVLDFRRRTTDLSHSIGLTLSREGQIVAVQWDSPAFDAGLTVGVQVVAVDGLVYDPETLKAAIDSAKGGTAPTQLIVKSGDRYRVVQVDYHGGLRFPRLERIPAARDRIGEIFSPLR
jgi:predicted metalloprotease with PDZ domain